MGSFGGCRGGCAGGAFTFMGACPGACGGTAGLVPCWGGAPLKSMRLALGSGKFRPWSAVLTWVDQPIDVERFTAPSRKALTKLQRL